MVRSHRNILSNWREAAVASALVATALIAVPVTARAGGLFDLFFSGFQQRPANVNSYAEPPAPIGRVAPVSPGGSESVNQGSDTGHGVAFCVRLCDGQHFPLERASNSTPVETCRAMCPASKTKVFFGSEIGASRAGDGQRYTDIDNAFIYRKQLVSNCTCNGRDAFGLAPYEANSDPTLRPGDIVTTKDGFVAYAGKTSAGASFTPLDTAIVSAQLAHTAAPVRVSRRGTLAAAPVPAPTRVSDDEDPGLFTPSPTAPLAGIRAQSLR
ncbi:MAG: DUF2865 domain-containing protein [Xanthobacteraceae bacterium]